MISDSEKRLESPVDEKLPPPFEPVMFVCARFRCSGYIDAEKVWHYSSNQEEIKEVVVRWERLG